MATNQVIPNGASRANAELPADQAAAVRMFYVFTAPTGCADNMEPVTTTQRNSGDKTVPEDQRHRSIHVPTYTVDGVPSKYQALILDAIRKAAAQQLAELWAADRNLREVPAALFSVDGVLTYWAREAEKLSLTADSIGAWFDQSAAAARAKAAGKDATKFRTLVCKLSAKVLSGEVTDKHLETIAATISADAKDAQHAIGAQLLNKVRNAQAKRAAALAEVDEGGF